MGSKQTKVVEFPKKKASNPPIGSSSIDVNASSEPAFPALTLDELRQQVTRIVMYGTFRETKHSSLDRGYRNVSQDDIVAMLQGSWVLSAEPDWDAEHRNWEYKLSGVDIEGDPLSLKLDVNVEMQRITIITKY